MDQSKSQSTKKEQDKKEQDSMLQIMRIIAMVMKKQQETQSSKVQIFGEILRLMKNIVDTKETNPKLFQQQIQQLSSQEKIILWFGDHLIDPKPQIRFSSMKFLRYLIEDKSILSLYRQKGIHYFIARSLERDHKQVDQKNQAAGNTQQYIYQEILQALKFIHRWLEVSAAKFPKALGNALVSFAESCGEQFKRYAIITLRVFALNAPDMCGWCGGIRLLIDSAMEPYLTDISDQIVWALLYLLNEPHCRQTIKVYLDLSKWFSIFTEIDPPIESNKDKSRTQTNRFEAQLNLAKKALISVLKSWQGLIYLGNERQALKSIVQALRQPIKPVIRSAIYDVLKDLLALGSKENSGVAVATRSNDASSQNIQGEFKINNLLNNYLVMLVQVLLDCDLFKILVELSGLEDPEVATPAQKFLKELSSLMFNLIPDCHRYTEFLISAANQNDPFLMDLKSWSSEIVNTMGNYAFDSEKKKKHAVSKFLYQCENLYLTTQLGLPSHKINNETMGIIRGQIEQEADENRFQNLIKQSNVSSSKEDQSKWHWESILELLETFLNNSNRFTEAIKNKFLKTLVTYYLPSTITFVNTEWRPENFIQAKCGYLLIKLLIRDRKGRELISQTGEGYFKISKSYISDLASLLKADNQLTQSVVNRSSHPTSQSFGDGVPIDMDPISQMLSFPNPPQRDSVPVAGVGRQPQHNAQAYLAPDIYNQRMIREYISWIGLLSYYKHGHEILKNNNIYQMLMNMVDRNGKRDHILIHLVHSFDYAKQGVGARDFFQHCITKGSQTLMKASIDFLKLLYRTQLIDFSPWAIDLLVQVIDSGDEEIGLKALSVVEEVTQDNENMTRFIEKVNLKRLLFLSQKSGSQFIITMLSNSKGFKRMYREEQATLLGMLDNWRDEESLKYIEKVEKVMCDALEFIQNEENQILFKFPLLLSNAENSLAALQFLHKLPWMMYLNFDCKDFDGTLPLIVTIDQYSNTKFTLQGRPYYQADYLVEKSVINLNHNFCLKLYLTVGKVNIDNTCKDVQEHYLFRCDSNEKRHYGVSKDGILTIEKQGVQFVFEEEGNRLRLKHVNVNFRLGESKNNTIKMPAHIFGELSYTVQGFTLLNEKNYIQHFIDQIKNENTSVQVKRSALWTIGQIAQSQHGVELLNSIKLIDYLVDMAEQCPVLSLRGTCLYTLNLICTTSTGRKQLESSSWISYRNCNLGWLCVPKNIYQFFYIRFQLKEGERSYWALKEEIWDKYLQVQNSLRLSPDDTKLLETIALMSNFLTHKDAEKQIQLMKTSKPALFQNIDVVHSLLLILTFYKFRSQQKNRLYQFFEGSFTRENIGRILESPIYQQIGCPDGTII